MYVYVYSSFGRLAADILTDDSVYAYTRDKNDQNMLKNRVSFSYFDFSSSWHYNKTQTDRRDRGNVGPLGMCRRLYLALHPKRALVY